MSNLGKPYSPAVTWRREYQISCPELESLVGAVHKVEGVLGARLTGARLGGCIVALVHRNAAADFQAYASRRYQAETGRATTIFACQSGPGAGECSLA